MQGIVFDIKRFAVHDGPGIRTTIFFKGCPLDCWWCHNPESISPDTQRSERNLRLGKSNFNEIQDIGKCYSVDQLMNEIEKDIVFYEESDGGITLSGGEPLHQGEFLNSLVNLCKEMEIHVCLDTSGYAHSTIIKKILPYIDLFLYDIKLIDDAQHQKYTGVSNKLILKNLEMLLAEKQSVIIRYPLIPGINNSDEQLKSLHQYLCNRVEEIHFLPYHSISKGKWKRLGLKNRVEGLEEIPGKEIDRIKDRFINQGYKVKIGG